MKIIVTRKQVKLLEQGVMRGLTNKFDPQNAPSDYLGPRGYLGAKQNRESEMIRSQINLSDAIKKFNCVPGNMVFFVANTINNKESIKQQLGVDDNTLIFLIKAAIGTMGRESDFGDTKEFQDEAAEFLIGWNLGWAVDAAQWVYNKTLGSDNQQSLGPGQFTEKTWNQYGLDKKIGPFSKSFTISKQALGIMFRLIDDYRTAIKNGAGTGPSVNPIAVRQGKIKSINGTGNNAWDLAIAAHNQGDWLCTSFCKTNNPDYNAPCNKSTWKVGTQTLTVNRNEKVPNYFPNAGSDDVPAIGYVEEVAGSIKQYSCITI